MTASPYVSFVTYGRNDGYTPSYTQRVSRATACLASQLERAGVDSEIIVCDWNPPHDRPSLLDMLEVPKALRHVSILGFVVPPEYHRKFVGSHERGMHPGEAANVGIRRALGSFITPKSSDTFLSPQTIAMIERRDLDPDAMYRIDRYDTTITDESIWQLDDQALLARLAEMPSTRLDWIEQLPYWGLRRLHTNAAGDFMLMHATYWQRLRGHPRDETVLSLDVDSLVMHAAAALGAREHRWPDDCRVYKPIHGNLSGARTSEVWKPWQRALNDVLCDHVSPTAGYWSRVFFDYPRRKVRGVESVVGTSFERNFVYPAGRWARGATPVPNQPENWGLADESLERRTLCRAAWDG